MLQVISVWLWGLFPLTLLGGLLWLLTTEERRAHRQRQVYGRLKRTWPAGDRRADPRLRRRVHVRYALVHPNGAIDGGPAAHENVSRGGMCIVLPEKLQVHTTLEFDVFFDSVSGHAKRINGLGEVVWTREASRHGSKDLRSFATGIRFVKLDPGQQQTLLALLGQSDAAHHAAPGDGTGMAPAV